MVVVCRVRRRVERERVARGREEVVGDEVAGKGGEWEGVWSWMRAWVEARRVGGWCMERLGVEWEEEEKEVGLGEEGEEGEVMEMTGGLDGVDWEMVMCRDGGDCG